MILHMQGKRIIITGGTRGLGLAYARHLASLGCHLALVDLSAESCRVFGEVQSVDALLSELSSVHGVTVRFYACDLIDGVATQQTVDRILSDFSGIDGVVTNAGGDVRGKECDASGGKAPLNTFFVSDADHDAIFSRNYDTCRNTLRAVIPYMQAQGYGKIVTVSSIVAGFGVEKETTYAVSKAAVVHLTRCLAAQLRTHGVNVNGIAPGPTKTGRFLATVKDRAAHDLQGLNSQARLNRIARPEDIASVVAFLLSDASDFISGQIIRVDGGLCTTPL